MIRVKELYSHVKHKKESYLLKVIKLFSQIVSMGVTLVYWSNGALLAEILSTVFVYAIISIPLFSMYFFKSSKISGPKIILLVCLISFGLEIVLNLFNDFILIILIANSLLLFFVKERNLRIASAVCQSNLLLFAILMALSLFDNILHYEILWSAKLLFFAILSLMFLRDFIRIGFALFFRQLKYFFTGYLFSGDMFSRNLALLFLTHLIDSDQLAGVRLFFQLVMAFVIKAQMDTFAINVYAAHGIEKDYKTRVQNVMWSNSKLCGVVYLLSALVCIYYFSIDVTFVIYATLLVIFINISAGPINLFLRKNNRDAGIILVNLPIFVIFCFYLSDFWSVEFLFNLFVMVVVCRFLWLIGEFKKT